MERRSAIGVLLLVACVLAVYAPSLRHGFVYDDFEVILEQAPLASPGDLLRIFAEPHGLPSSQLPYYRAVPRASLLLQKTWHGDVAAPFHLANALLAAAAGVAAFALLRLPVFGVPVGLAALAGALFAVHPVTSSVVYPVASGRETLLPALLWMISCWGFLRGGRGGRIVAVAGFAGALFGKEQAIALPAVLVWADLLRLAPDPPGRSARRWLVRYAPFAAVLLAYLALRGAIMPGLPEPGEGPPLVPDLLGPVRSALYALRAIFAPSAQLAYEPALPVWWSTPRVVLSLGLGVALAVASAARGPEARRHLLFWLGWAAASLALTANVFPQETQYDERFVFLALLAPVALAAELAAPWWRAPRPRAAVAAAGVALVAGASWLTLQRGEAFRDAVAFGRHWVASNPAHANARFTLGTALARRGQPLDAIPELAEAVRLAPSLSAARYNLAVVLAGEGRLDEAAAQLEALSELEPWNAEPHFMLTLIRERQGRHAEAARHREEAERKSGATITPDPAPDGGSAPDRGGASGPAGSP